MAEGRPRLRIAPVEGNLSRAPSLSPHRAPGRDRHHRAAAAVNPAADLAAGSRRRKPPSARQTGARGGCCSTRWPRATRANSATGTPRAAAGPGSSHTTSTASTSRSSAPWPSARSASKDSRPSDGTRPSTFTAPGPAPATTPGPPGCGDSKNTDPAPRLQASRIPDDWLDFRLSTSQRCRLLALPYAASLETGGAGDCHARPGPVHCMGVAKWSTGMTAADECWLR